MLRVVEYERHIIVPINDIPNQGNIQSHSFDYYKNDTLENYGQGGHNMP